MQQKDTRARPLRLCVLCLPASSSIEQLLRDLREHALSISGRSARSAVVRWKIRRRGDFGRSVLHFELDPSPDARLSRSSPTGVIAGLSGRDAVQPAVSYFLSGRLVAMSGSAAACRHRRRQFLERLRIGAMWTPPRTSR